MLSLGFCMLTFITEEDVTIEMCKMLHLQEKNPPFFLCRLS